MGGRAVAENLARLHEEHAAGGMARILGLVADEEQGAVLAEGVDGAALAGGVATLEYDDHAAARLEHVRLQLHQLDLEAVELLGVVVLVEFFGIREAAGRELGDRCRIELLLRPCLG